MPSTTPDGFPIPEVTDPFGNGCQAIIDLAEHLDANYVPWTDYTPLTSGVTMGTAGVVTGHYRYLFGQVDFACQLTLGFDSEVTGVIELSLPDGFGFQERFFEGLYAFDAYPFGVAFAQESTAPTWRVGVAHYCSISEPYMMRFTFDSGGGDANATRPFDWEPDDFLRVKGSYKAIPLP